jgi:hypothetical protein
MDESAWTGDSHGDLVIVLCLCLVNELQLSSWRTSRGAMTWEREPVILRATQELSLWEGPSLPE